MSTHVLFLAAALATGVVDGQQPTSAPPKPSSNTPDDRLTTPAIPSKVAVEGCVAREEEIGRKSDMAERAGMAEDFILVRARVLKGKGPVVDKASGAGVASAALQPMYEIGGLTDEQLKVHVGRRVRIEGSFGNLDREAPASPTNEDLFELNATTIRQVAGDCPLPKS
jgi:hypothetical protein